MIGVGGCDGMWMERDLWISSSNVRRNAPIYIHMNFPNTPERMRLLLIKQCLGKCYEELGFRVIRSMDRNMAGDPSKIEKIYRFLKIRIDTFKITDDHQELDCGPVFSNQPPYESYQAPQRFDILSTPRASQLLLDSGNTQTYQRIQALLKCLAVIQRRYQRRYNSFEEKTVKLTGQEYDLLGVEKCLIGLLRELPMILQRTLDELDPSHICQALIQLATHLSDYLVEGSRIPERMIITDDPRVTSLRISLITLCQRAITQGLNLLG